MFAYERVWLFLLCMIIMITLDLRPFFVLIWNAQKKMLRYTPWGFLYWNVPHHQLLLMVRVACLLIRFWRRTANWNTCSVSCWRSFAPPLLTCLPWPQELWGGEVLVTGTPPHTHIMKHLHIQYNLTYASQAFVFSGEAVVTFSAILSSICISLNLVI